MRTPEQCEEQAVVLRQAVPQRWISIHQFSQDAYTRLQKTIEALGSNTFIRTRLITYEAAECRYTVKIFFLANPQFTDCDLAFKNLSCKQLFYDSVVKVLLSISALLHVARLVGQSPTALSDSRTGNDQQTEVILG